MRKTSCFIALLAAIGIVGSMGCSDSREATAPETFAPFPGPAAEKGSLGKEKGSPNKQKPSNDDETG